MLQKVFAKSLVICIAKLKELFPNALILSDTTTPYATGYKFDYTPGEEPYTITRAEYSRAKTTLLEMHGISVFKALDESVTGGNINSEYYRETYYMDPDDTSHRNIEGMKQWMPLMDDYIAEEYKKFLASKS